MNAIRLLVAVLALAPTSAPAREWFVSTGGDDATGKGSLKQPFRTIKRVLSTSNGVARAGDTITVRGPAGNATYNECDVRLRVPLTLRSHPGERAHIHCDITTPDSVTVQIDAGASGSRLSNLEISGGAYYGVMLQTDWYRGEGEHLTGASDVILEDLLIRDTGRDGIKVTPRSDRATIRRVEIRNTGAIHPPGTPLDKRNADGIDNVNGSGMVVEDSYIHDISTTGLYFKGGSADVIVQRNRIENTGMAGILVGFDTSPEFFNLDVNPQYYESVRGIVRNNLVRNTDYAGIGLYAAKDALVANNTIENAARVGHAAIYFGVTFQDWEKEARRPATINPRIVNNLVVRPAGTCVEIRWSRELGGLSALDGATGMNANGYDATRSPCRFVDHRPGSPLRGGGDLDAWRTLPDTEVRGISARFSLDARGRPLPGDASIGAGIVVREVVDDAEGHARRAPYDLGAFAAPAQTAPPATPAPASPAHGSR
ncbi:right-handed parallel beta-helix repeat-containing protein [Dokdonella sp. MW10]|uniref:right-handed parallel beta-helix repeat-containing protein n=1 Tax=Dokdonella sp. MW10 TaxID=2992926 RepID=UPI003F7D0EFC